MTTRTAVWDRPPEPPPPDRTDVLLIVSVLALVLVCALNAWSACV